MKYIQYIKVNHFYQSIYFYFIVLFYIFKIRLKISGCLNANSAVQKQRNIFKTSKESEHNNHWVCNIKN